MIPQPKTLSTSSTGNSQLSSRIPWVLHHSIWGNFCHSQNSRPMLAPSTGSCLLKRTFLTSTNSPTIRSYTNDSMQSTIIPTPGKMDLSCIKILQAIAQNFLSHKRIRCLLLSKFGSAGTWSVKTQRCFFITNQMALSSFATVKQGNCSFRSLWEMASLKIYFMAH